MAEIDEKEELNIDNIKDKVLILKKGDKTFNIDSNDIFCYGEIDFNDKETLDIINNFKFLNNLSFRGVSIIAKYNYNEHCCYSKNNKPMWSETWNPLDLVKFAHGSLGKPKRIVLFKS